MFILLLLCYLAAVSCYEILAGDPISSNAVCFSFLPILYHKHAKAFWNELINFVISLSLHHVYRVVTVFNHSHYYRISVLCPVCSVLKRTRRFGSWISFRPHEEKRLLPWSEPQGLRRTWNCCPRLHLWRNQKQFPKRRVLLRTPNDGTISWNFWQ